MAKILFIVPPLTGHINPTVALGQHLSNLGHNVAWIGFESVLKASLPPECRIHALQEESYLKGTSKSEVLSVTSDKVKKHGAQERRGFAGLHYLWEEVLLPLARSTFEEVESIVLREQPTLCIVDQQMLSGTLVCQKHRQVYLTSATTSAALIDVLEALPQVNEWHQQLLINLWKEQNISLLDDERYLNTENNKSSHRLDLSPWGTLAFSSRRLTLSTVDQQDLAKNIHFVGPALEGKRAHIEFPWDRLIPQLPKLFVSMGTVNAHRASHLYQRIVEALSDLDIQVIFAAPIEYFSKLPPHWIVCQRVPQLQLLAYMDAVFCHGGHNTTMEALSFGLPLVIAPIRDDQPVIAEQVKSLGAGVRVHFTRSKPKRLRQAIEEVLFETHYRIAAQKIRAEFMGAVFMSSDQATLTQPIILAKELGAHRAGYIVEKCLRQLGHSTD